MLRIVSTLMCSGISTFDDTFNIRSTLTRVLPGVKLERVREALIYFSRNMILQESFSGQRLPDEVILTKFTRYRETLVAIYILVDAFRVLSISLNFPDEYIRVMENVMPLS